MGREIVYCALCGERIPPEHVEKGVALRIESRHFCKTCVANDPHVPTLVTGATSPFYSPEPATPRKPAVAKRPATPEGTRPPPPPRRSDGGSLGLVLGLVAGVGAAVVVGMFIFLARPAAPVSKPPVAKGPATAPGPGAEEERQRLAKEAAQKRKEDAVREARALAAEKKFDEALKRLDEFPGELATVRTEIEWARDTQPRRPWAEVFDEAQAAWKSKDYATSKRLYLEGMKSAPVETPPTEAAHTKWQWGHFNLAEMHARDGEIDLAFVHLKSLFSFRNNLGHTCKCQNSCVDQMAKNEVWAPLRADARYAAMIKALPARK
jgi:hypothetical protein